MNITEEFMRIQNIIENMPMEEFEQMLERNGMDRILPSCSTIDIASHEY